MVQLSEEVARYLLSILVLVAYFMGFYQGAKLVTKRHECISND